MGYYSFRIERAADKCFFALYPNNNSNQEIGRSPLYDSLDLCRAALANFRHFVKENQISDDTSPCVQVEKREKGYIFEYHDGTTILFFREKGYVTVQNCIAGIGCVWQNIDADLK